MSDRPYRVRDNKYLNTVRGQECLIHGCNQPGSAHHLTFAQPRAMARKTGDQWTVPLCHKHHMELHDSGMREPEWWALEGVDPVEWAEESYKEYLDGNFGL